MSRGALVALVAVAVWGTGAPVPLSEATASLAIDPVLLTGEGPTLRVGPAEASHAVGLLANGAGAIGVAVAADGAFVAFTCGMRPQADVWFSGDWYRGRFADDGRGEAVGPDGERLTLDRTKDGRLSGTLRSPAGEELSAELAPAASTDGLYRRDDADGVLGAVALPGNAVCAVKRTLDDRFLPAGTVPY